MSSRSFRLRWITLWILVGALSASVGFGLILLQANRDRRLLAQETQQAKQQSEHIRAVSESLVREANQKLAVASKDILRAQQLIQQFQNERSLMVKAVTLKPPSPRLLKTWREAVSFPLGISLRLPPQTRPIMDEKALVAITENFESLGGEDQWLSISHYDSAVEQRLEQTLTDTESLAYFVNGHLLGGKRGKLADIPGTVYVLRAQNGATPTHLIWARTNHKVSTQILTDALSTLAFQN